jgi:hypothetical protein
MKTPRQLPDRLLRTSLERPANLHDFLQSALPKEVDHLDFGGVQLLPREFFTADWREREADLIFEIPYQTGGQKVPALVGVMIEHQSDTDVAVPLRALINLTGYWDRRWRQWTERPRPRGSLLLLPVFSVVLYTANVPWGSNTNIQDLLAPPATFHPFAPSWGPVFWNLGEWTPEHLLAGGTWMQVMAVVRMTAAERAAFESVYTAAVEQLQAIQGSDPVRWSELLGMILSYALFRRPPDERDTLRSITEKENPTRIEEVKTMWKTIADVEREEGELKHARFILRRLLEKHFNPLPVAVVQRIEAADNLDRLNAEALRADEMKSLDELKL